MRRLEAALRETWQRSRFDFLVNNAGLSKRGSIAEFTEAGLGEDTMGRTIWRNLMATRTYPYVSELRSQGREEGRVEGRAEGRAEGRVESWPGLAGARAVPAL